jgi:hypothetical protein
MKNSVIQGIASYIVQRNLKTIKDIVNRLIAGVNPQSSIGILDNYVPEIRLCLI